MIIDSRDHRSLQQSIIKKLIVFRFICFINRKSLYAEVVTKHNAIHSKPRRDRLLIRRLGKTASQRLIRRRSLRITSYNFYFLYWFGTLQRTRGGNHDMLLNESICKSYLLCCQNCINEEIGYEICHFAGIS